MVALSDREGKRNCSFRRESTGAVHGLASLEPQVAQSADHASRLMFRWRASTPSFKTMWRLSKSMSKGTS